MENKELVYSESIGLWVFLPLIFFAIAGLVEGPLVGILLGGGIIVNYIISIVFTVSGFKTKVRWMLLWIIAFLIIAPFSNIVFWLLNIKGKNIEQVAMPSDESKGQDV